VGPRAGLDDVEKRKFLTLPGLELRLQPPAHAGSSLADVFALKLEAITSSETSVRTSTRCHIPENGILYLNMVFFIWWGGT
jgi:hypothetical protein